MVPASEPSRPANETGLLLSLVLIGLLLVLLIAALVGGIRPGTLQRGAGGVLLGLYLIAWGCMFLASYYFSHKSFFLRALIWVCENFSHPAGRKMAFFYFALAVVLGTLSLLAGLGIT